MKWLQDACWNFIIATVGFALYALLIGYKFQRYSVSLIKEMSSISKHLLRRLIAEQYRGIAIAKGMVPTPKHLLRRLIAGQYPGNGIAKGMALTLEHLFRKPITTQYPEERLTVSRRTRGNELLWDRIKCTGCATCAKSCPQGCIEIITSENKETNTYVVDKFEVDNGHCIFCGLCVEACPYEALFMGYEYERARYRRQELVMTKEDLLLSDKKQPSGYARPKIEVTLPRQTLLLDRDKVKK